MSVELEVEKALFARLAALSGLSYSWPGVPYQGTTPFVEVHGLRSGSDRIAQDGLSVYRGALQAAIVHRADGGLPEAMDQASQIKAHFPTDLQIVAGDYRVHIYKAPDIGSADLDGNTIRVPVSIYHQTFG